MHDPRKLQIAIEALERIRIGEEFVFDDEMQCDVPVAMTGEEASEIAEEALMGIENFDISAIWNEADCKNCENEQIKGCYLCGGTGRVVSGSGK